MENPVIIFGAKNIGRVALDIFSRNGVLVYCFLDDDAQLHNTEINEIVVMGATDDEGITKLIGKKCEAFVAVEDSAERKQVVETLKDFRQVMPVNAVHDKAIISEAATIGHGNLFGAGVIVNAAAKISNHCLVHSGAIIDVGAKIGDFVQIGAGSVIGAGVQIADGAFVGAGVTIIAGVSIGPDASVGAGSVVIQDVAEDAKVFGNPAKKV